MSCLTTITTRSRLSASAPLLWRTVTSAEGINHELAPWLRMTAPAELKNGGLERVVLGERLCRSWILLFGLVPIDYDDITVTHLEPGRRFMEQSPMFSQRHWEHERTIDTDPAGGCLLTDRITFEPRHGVPASLARTILAAIFRHRHARLRRRFDGALLEQKTRPGL